MAARIERPSGGGRQAGTTERMRGELRVQPVDRRRRSRISELVLGVVIVAGFGLGVVLWHTSSTSGQSALVLAHPVKAGDVLHADVLRAETVRLGATVAHVDAADATSVIGRVATADLAAGTLVAPALFVARPPIPAGATVVAAALVPGQFASFGLRPGQAVTVRTGTSDRRPAGAVITHADGVRGARARGHHRHQGGFPAGPRRGRRRRRLGGRRQGGLARTGAGGVSVIAVGSLRGGPVRRRWRWRWLLSGTGGGGPRSCSRPIPTEGCWRRGSVSATTRRSPSSVSGPARA